MIYILTIPIRLFMTVIAIAVSPILIIMCFEHVDTITDYPEALSIFLQNTWSKNVK